MTTMHICMSVRGALNKTKAQMKQLAPCIVVDGVPLKTAEQVRDFFLDQLSMGHEVIPCGECDNFDYKKGCLGHNDRKGE